MAATHPDKDALARVRREQRMQGRPSAFSGLRIVLSAAAITVAILLAAFGAIGMLLLARVPQEPIARQPDPVAPSVMQTELPPEQAPAPELVANEPLILPAPEPVPFPSQDQLEKEAAALPPPVVEEEPETTAAIPDAVAEPPEEIEEQAPQVQPKNRLRRKVQQQKQQQQRVVRRPVQRKSEPRSDNPLLQLFGIRQYR